MKKNINNDHFCSIYIRIGEKKIVEIIIKFEALKQIDALDFLSQHLFFVDFFTIKMATNGQLG